MLCCLCIKEMDFLHGTYVDGQQLYNDDGKHNEVFDITMKYFAAQLSYLETAAEAKPMLSKTICSKCWQCISEFNAFQQDVVHAHDEFVKCLCLDSKNELVAPAFIKMEAEMPMNAMLENVTENPAIIDIDPVKIEQQSEDLATTTAREQAALSSSDDDKPLLTRIQNKAKTLKAQNSTIQTATTRKGRPKRQTVQNQHKTKQIKAVTAASIDNEASDRLLKKREQDEFIAQHWSHEMKCGQCEQACANFAGVRMHFREVHNSTRSYVMCCQRKYFHRYHLVDHIQIHLDPEYFKCKDCGKCLGNRRSLRTHIKESHMTPQPLERRYECEICHKRFAKAGILKGHMDIHAEGSKDYVCNVCGKGFVLKHRLAIHQRNVHDPTGGGVCDQCGKSFRDRYAFKRHLLEHAGISKEKWPCDECNAQLHSKFSLRRHKRLAHHDGTTVYRCSECGKVALTEDALRSHKKYMHEKKRIYKCNICGKAFKVAVVLKEHMTTHTGEDLYNCPHCPKTFKVCANMHHHRKRVHPKEWAETRQHRALASQSDISTAANEVVM